MTEERVTLNFEPGTHVLTMHDSTGKVRPVIMFTWTELGILIKALTPPEGFVCPIPDEKCLLCGLLKEMIDIRRERGPRHA